MINRYYSVGQVWRYDIYDINKPLAKRLTKIVELKTLIYYSTTHLQKNQHNFVTHIDAWRLFCALHLRALRVHINMAFKGQIIEHQKRKVLNRRLQCFIWWQEQGIQSKLTETHPKSSFKSSYRLYLRDLHFFEKKTTWTLGLWQFGAAYTVITLAKVDIGLVILVMWVYTWNTDRPWDRQTDRQTERQTEKQTEGLTDR